MRVVKRIDLGDPSAGVTMDEVLRTFHHRDVGGVGFVFNGVNVALCFNRRFCAMTGAVWPELSDLSIEQLDGLGGLVSANTNQVGGA